MSITQASHGLSTNNAVYHNGTIWVKAQSNNINTLGIGVVVVSDANNFILYLVSQVSTGLSGLTAGQYYYVSDATAGLITTTEPTASTSFSNPILYALSATSGIVLPYRPTQINPTSLTIYGTTGVTTVTYATTVNLDLTTLTSNIARITLTGPCTINITGGNDGQKVILELLQDGTGGRVVTLGTGWKYGTDITSYTGTTTLNKRDILGLEYNTSLSGAMLIGVARGY